MPLDATAYLAARGWQGKGRPLRPYSDGITKPVIITQKKTLSGVGKDRDEQFAFWDHIYNASVQAIEIKIHAESDAEDDEDESHPSPEAALPFAFSSLDFARTHTGILSNRRPTETPTTGTSTPIDCSACSSGAPAKPSLMSLAFREAAKRGLYSKFIRGPVIGLDWGLEDVTTKGSDSAGIPDPAIIMDVQRRTSDKERSRSETEDCGRLRTERKEKRSRRSAQAPEVSRHEDKIDDHSCRENETKGERRARKVAKKARRARKAERRKRKAESVA